MGQGLIPGDREDVMSPKALIPELGVRLVVLGTPVGAVHRGTGTWQAGIRNCTDITHTRALSLSLSQGSRERVFGSFFSGSVFPQAPPWPGLKPQTLPLHCLGSDPRCVCDNERLNLTSYVSVSPLTKRQLPRGFS